MTLAKIPASANTVESGQQATVKDRYRDPEVSVRKASMCVSL